MILDSPTKNFGLTILDFGLSINQIPNPKSQIQNLVTSNFFLASAASDILENSEDTSRAIRESFEQTWQQAIRGPLYTEVASIGAGIAVIFIGLWAAHWWRATLDSGVNAKAFYDLILPVLIVILLGNPANRGTLFGNLTIQLHNAMNALGELVLVGLNENISEDVVTQAVVKSDVQAIADNALKECAAIQEVKERNDCFDYASQKITDLLYPFRGEVWARDLQQELSARLTKAKGTEYASSNFLGRVFGGLGGVLNPITTQISVGLFIVVGAAFQWALEYTAIMTAILGPLFLGASLLPVPGKPITLWLSSFLGLGLMKTSYSVVVGLAAITVLNSGPSTSPMIFPLIAGAFGPIIALAMGSFGGVGLFATFVRLGSFFSVKL